MVVIFNPEKFKAIYPQFEKLADVVLQNLFDNVTMILNNTETSIVPYNPENGVKDREQLLTLLTAHLATLLSKQVVGALTSATEGSTSASFYIPQQRGADWFYQTQFGYTYWQMTAKYRYGGVLLNDKSTHF